MEIKQNPFSLYDFLGYFTPGAIFLYGCIAIYSHITPSFKPLNYFSFDKGEIYIPFILVAYTTGHLLSFCSSIFVEKFSEWSVGYPSKYLLAVRPKPYFSEGHKGIRLLVALLLLPLSLIDWLLEVTIHYRRTYAKPLDPLLINIILSKVVTLLKEHSGLQEPPDGGLQMRKIDFFRFVYHYTLEYAPNHSTKMQNYVALYGFLRTLTFISVSFFWGLLWHLYEGLFSHGKMLFLLGGSAIISYAFYIAFNKFYRRFSLESLMALTAIYPVKELYPPEFLGKLNQL